MVFSSAVFLLVFLPLTLCVYYNPFFKSRGFRNGTLLSFSLLFYAWGEPLFVFMMLLSILINWFLVLLMDRQPDGRKRRLLMMAAVAFDLSLIFVFKYLGFVAENIGLLLGKTLQVTIVLPIGISFFTFQIMSYVIDVYRRNAPVQTSLRNVALYISLFPQLIAGPIVRYETIAEQIEGRQETPSGFTAGVSRFAFGLGKKVLLANYTGLIADNIFGAPTALSPASAWLGVVAYALQIYFDFSGYSDMAIGLGRMFGFHFLENFNYPYIASSVTDFWRRWHISLSTWFRDYVYIPLGGNRVNRLRWVGNLFAVWLLTGIWHGANWTFIVWGLYYFVFLLVEKLSGLDKRRNVFTHLYTLVVALVGWVLFRSETLPLAIRYLGDMFSLGNGAFTDEVFHYYIANGKWVLLAAVVCTLPLPAMFRSYIQKLAHRQPAASLPGALLSTMDLLKTVAMAVILVISVLVSVSSDYNPFIYFNF